MRKIPELLSPAGSIEAVKAAVCCGADAVYLGAASFGARSAVGFDEVSLKETISFCHLHHKRVYVTVNTLIRDDEFQAVSHTLETLSSLRADAVILQDIGLLQYIREYFPELDIHISTQMSLHNRAGALFALNQGAKRVVLARECNLSTIREVVSTGIETEVFVHGAMCVSVSGQCLFSSMIGGRSGNRGRCAQPCRMEYSYLGKKGSLLSPRDLCLRNRIPELIEAGVSSFKIEGRLKRPEYVALVTSVYRNAIDSYLNGDFHPADKEERSKLTQIFSRGGFTEGYAFGEQDARIIYSKRSTPDGLIIGTACQQRKFNNVVLCECSLQKALHNGDYLEIGEQNIIYSGNEIPAGRTAILRLHKPVRIGSVVRRLQDESLLKSVSDEYRIPENVPRLRIPISGVFSANPLQTAQLTLTDGISTSVVVGNICDIAQSAPITADAVRKSLSKTGGTFFSLNELTCDIGNVFIPTANLNKMRRDALRILEEERIRHFEEKDFVQRNACSTEPVRYAAGSCRLFTATYSATVVNGLRSAGADQVIWIPGDYTGDALEKCFASDLENGTWIALPIVCSDSQLLNILSIIRKYRMKPALRNVGQLSYVRSGEAFICMQEIPVYNKRTASFLFRSDCSGFTVSPELSGKEAASLLSPAVGNAVVTVYGRQRLMTLTHCPVRTGLELSGEKAECRLCEQNSGVKGTSLRDHLSHEFPLFPSRLEDGCRIDLMNSKKLDLSPFASELRRDDLSWLLFFTDEKPEEQLRITKHFFRLMHGLPEKACISDTTVGRYKEGVE